MPLPPRKLMGALTVPGASTITVHAKNTEVVFWEPTVTKPTKHASCMTPCLFSVLSAATVDVVYTQKLVLVLAAASALIPVSGEHQSL